MSGVTGLREISLSNLTGTEKLQRTWQVIWPICVSPHILIGQQHFSSLAYIAVTVQRLLSESERYLSLTPFLILNVWVLGGEMNGCGEVSVDYSSCCTSMRT